MSRTWKKQPDPPDSRSVIDYLDSIIPIGLDELISRLHSLDIDAIVDTKTSEFRIKYGNKTGSYWPFEGTFQVQLRNFDHSGNEVVIATNRHPTKKRLSRNKRGKVTLERFVDGFFSKNELNYKQYLLHFDDEEHVIGAPETFSETIINVNRELLAYLAHHPNRIHDLTSRQFEELVADILKDFGFDVELTRATRDGGKDILAYISNEVVSFLTFIECKKYSPEHKVGVDVIRQVYGVQRIYRAHKSIIVTTSSFTAPAISERNLIENEMDLKGYDDLKKWLSRYQTTKPVLIIPNI